MSSIYNPAKGGGSGLNKAEVEAVARELGVGVYNVKHYGAKGTGSGNDLPAYEEAIAVAEASGGGVIHTPPAASPTGFYRLEGKITYKVSANIHFTGAYQSAEIRLVKDLEFGDCIIQERGTTEQPGNIKHHFIGLFCRGPQTWPTSPSSSKQQGYMPSRVSGIECPGNSIIQSCFMEGFYAGYFCREFSQKFSDCVDFVNLYGTYIGPNSLGQPFIKGGISRVRHQSFPLWARVGVHPNYVTEGSNFVDEDGSNEPYYFYKEAPNGTTGAFVESGRSNHLCSQATGLSVLYDENCASSLPAEYFKEPSTFGMWASSVNMIKWPGSRIGNVHLLDLSKATAGTFKIVLPAQKGSGAGAGNQFAGATTAAIAYNASNATIQSALNAVVGSESTAVVSTREGKKQILLTGKASLMAGTAITLETGSLTGEATVAALEIDPGMGPVVRPCTARIVQVKNATGGTFTLTAKVAGVEYTTAAIAYNASPQVVSERLWKAMGHPFGVVVGQVSETGKYWLFFNGRSLNQTVELSANIASLTGAGAEVAFSEGSSAGLALRHSEYTVDVGKLKATFMDASFTINCGTVGFMRLKGELEGEFRGDLAGQLISEVASGEMILVELGGTNQGFTFYTKGAQYRLMKMAGEVKKNALLAVKSGQEAELYPTGSTPPAAGYAAALVPAATTRRIPVKVSATGNTSSATEPEYSGAAPANNAWLKPSTETAGKVATGTLGTDYIVGAAIAAGSGGKVKVQPRGMA